MAAVPHCTLSAMKITLLRAACLTAAFLLTGCRDALSPDAELRSMRPIVFVGRTWGIGQSIGDPKLYIVRPDGSELRRLTDRDGEEFAPAWSPDGRSIAFSTGAAVWIANADGSGIRQVEGAPVCYYTPPTHLSWSPDGTRLAAGCWAETAIVPVQGGQSYSLSNIVGTDVTYPDWSPVDDRIAYYPSLPSEVRTVRPDGSDVKTLVRMRVEGMTWSPDGRRIAYFGGPDGIRTLMIANSDGSGAYEVMERSAVPGLMFGAEWSPDGRWLTFQAENTYCETRGTPPSQVCEGHYGVYVVRTNGQDLRKITPLTLQSGRPTW